MHRYIYTHTPLLYAGQTANTATLCTTAVREAGVSRHHGGAIKGPPLNPSIR